MGPFSITQGNQDRDHRAAGRPPFGGNAPYESFVHECPLICKGLGARGSHQTGFVVQRGNGPVVRARPPGTHVPPSRGRHVRDGFRPVSTIIRCTHGNPAGRAGDGAPYQGRRPLCPEVVHCVQKTTALRAHSVSAPPHDSPWSARHTVPTTGRTTRLRQPLRRFPWSVVPYGPRRQARRTVGRDQPRCMASQIAVASRTPSVVAEAQCRTQVATPSGVPLR